MKGLSIFVVPAISLAACEPPRSLPAEPEER